MVLNIKKINMESLMLKAIFFSKKGFEKLSENVNGVKGVLSILFISLLLTIPDKFEDFRFLNVVMNFFKIFVFFVGLMSVIFLFVRILGSRVAYREFVSTVCFNLFLSLVIVSLPAFIITHLIINILFGIQILSLVLFSMIPYYNFLIFGWSCEIASEFKGIKAWFIAIFSMTLLFLLFFSLSYITV